MRFRRENRYTPLARALGSRVVRGFEGDRPAWKNWLLDEALPFPISPACFGDFAAGLVDDVPLAGGGDVLRLDPA